MDSPSTGGCRIAHKGSVGDINRPDRNADRATIITAGVGDEGGTGDEQATPRIDGPTNGRCVGIKVAIGDSRRSRRMDCAARRTAGVPAKGCGVDVLRTGRYEIDGAPVVSAMS